MAIGEAGRPPRHPSHVECFGWFDHDAERPAGKRPGAHPAVGRDLNGPRGVNHHVVLVKGASIGDPVRQALQRRADGQRDVFRRGRRAEHAQLTHGVVATPHAVDQASRLHALEEVCGGRLRLPETLLHFLEGERQAAFCHQIVCKDQALLL